MKILFIHRYNFFTPIGIMSLSAVLKNNGHSCYFIDLAFCRNIIKEISAVQPEIIAYSINIGNYKYYYKLNLKLKKHFQFFSIFGGTHPTLNPDFISLKGVDSICIGEGEFAFLELADKMQAHLDYTKVENIWVKVNDVVYKNINRPLIGDLDLLPFPDRDLIYKYEVYKRSHTKWVLASRGCIYNCSYCYNSAINKITKSNSIRSRSADNVISELLVIKQNFSPKKIHFIDDILNYDQQWIIDFLIKYKEKIKIPFIAIIRLNLINENIVKLLKVAGCYLVECGIETGNEAFREKVLNRHMTNEKIIEACNLLKKYGIKILSLNILGLPDETVDMARETLALNKTCHVDYASSSIFQPYPGTELAKYALSKEYYNDQIQSIRNNWYTKGSDLKMIGISQIVRSHYLMNIFVKIPVLFRIFKPLVALPFDLLYKILFFIDKSIHLIFVINKIDISEIFLFLRYRVLKPRKIIE